MSAAEIAVELRDHRAPGKVAHREREPSCARPHVDASKDGELSGGLPVTPPRSMGFGLAVATIVQFQTAAMLIMCPFMFGLLGLLLGAICVTLWFGVSTYISVRMADEVIARPHITSLTSFGDALFGKTGRYVCIFVQLLGCVLFMPLGIAIIAMTLRFGLAGAGATGILASEGSCTAYWTVGTWGVLTLMTQALRNFGTSVFLFVLSLLFIFSKEVTCCAQGATV